MRQVLSESRDGEKEDTPDVDPDFEALLGYLKRTRGFDFTGYKRASLKRRVLKRMQMSGVNDFVGYRDYLEVHPDEFEHLFNTILINVTAFFRDPLVWAYLKDVAVPRLLESIPSDAPLRVWSACCASGEEAYSLAILLAEALGLDQFRERVKVYATDIDEEALSHGRQASYSQREAAGVPPDLLAKYFDARGGYFTLHKDLRRAVIFGRHDLIQDAPISRINLLTCRNALMYLNAEAQARVLARLHFALDNSGLLLLGKAEMLFAHGSLFSPLDLRYRVFTKIPRANPPGRLLLAMGANQEVAQDNNDWRIREMVFKTGPVAQVAVDIRGHLALINDRARALFRLGEGDIDRPLQDLELSYRPADLRSMIDQAYAERRPVIRHEVAWGGPPGETQYLDVQAVAVQEIGGQLLGAAITFTDVTSLKRLQDELHKAHRELETAYEELQSTNEELETTNEELQSTVEELETTNEELQSINEELETMNEELQSTNEDLQTTNDEARSRASELDHVNAYLGAILTSLRAGVVVLDRNLLIQIWNRKAEDLWGLRSEEVLGEQFLLLDIGLPVDRLRQPIRDCLGGEGGSAEIVIAARNRRGRDFACLVTCTPLVGPDGATQGAIIVMEETDQAGKPLGDDGAAECPTINFLERESTQ